MSAKTVRWTLSITVAVAFLAICLYVISIGWRWNRPVNLDNLLLVAIAGAVAVFVLIGAIKCTSILLTFLIGPAWVAFVYLLVFWNDGNGPPQLLINFAAVFATVIGVPIGAVLALMMVASRYIESRSAKHPTGDDQGD